MRDREEDVRKGRVEEGRNVSGGKWETVGSKRWEKEMGQEHGRGDRRRRGQLKKGRREKHRVRRVTGLSIEQQRRQTNGGEGERRKGKYVKGEEGKWEARRVKGNGREESGSGKEVYMKGKL